MQRVEFYLLVALVLGPSLCICVHSAGIVCRRRAQNLQAARDHTRAGNASAAYEHYQRAVDITPEVAQQFIKVCSAQDALGRLLWP